MVNFGALAAEIGLPVWGTPANFKGVFRVPKVRENWKRSVNLSDHGKSGKMQKWLESQGKKTIYKYCT